MKEANLQQVQSRRAFGHHRRYFLWQSNWLPPFWLFGRNSLGQSLLLSRTQAETSDQIPTISELHLCYLEIWSKKNGDKCKLMIKERKEVRNNFEPPKSTWRRTEAIHASPSDTSLDSSNASAREMHWVLT